MAYKKKPYTVSEDYILFLASFTFYSKWNTWTLRSVFILSTSSVQQICNTINRLKMHIQM